MEKCPRRIFSLLSDGTGETMSYACDKPGILHPVIDFRGPSEATLVLPFLVCADHLDDRPETYLDDDAWHSYMRRFKQVGAALPDRDRTRIRFLGPADPEVCKVKAGAN